MNYEERILKVLDNGPLTQAEIAKRIKFKAKTQVYIIVKRMVGKGLVGRVGELVMKIDNSNPFPIEQINRAVEAAIPKPDIKVAILQEEIDECDLAIHHYQRVRSYLLSRVSELQQ